MTSATCALEERIVSVKTPTGRQQKQKKLLLLNVSEIYELFKAESNIQVGLDHAK